MRAIQHTSSNDVLRPPQGATAEECHPLFITRARYEDGTPVVISFWQPTPEQLRLLNEGKPVWLCAIGMTHPPLALGVEGDGRPQP